MARPRVDLSRAPASLSNIDFRKNIFEKVVVAIDNCIQIDPMNVLSKIQKEILKLLPPVMRKNLMKLSFCKKLVGEAMSILQQSGVKVFENFFLYLA